MPYRSEKQRSYLHMSRPEIAKRWDEKYGKRIKPLFSKRKPTK